MDYTEDDRIGDEAIEAELVREARNETSGRPAREERGRIARWLWRLVGRFAVWAHGGEPVWYMHRQWTIGGRILNLLARLHTHSQARENKLWCAMCGKLTDHRSGGCPELRSPNNGDVEHRPL